MSGSAVIFFAPQIFTINFASYFTGVLQSVQTDLGLTYGTTMLAAGTTPPVITLSGTLAAAYVPILIQCTLSGALGTWQGRVSYDGGSTFPQTFTSASTVALTGAGAGLTINIAAGAAVSTGTQDTWTATCAGLNDQSGSGVNYSQATAIYQPILTVGLSGFPGIAFDGSNDVMVSSLSLPAPGTTPTWIGMVFRQITWISNGCIISDPSGNSCLIYNNPATLYSRAFNGAQGGAVSQTINTWECTEAGFTYSASDYLRRGSSASSVGTIFGNNASTSRNFGAQVAGGNPTNIEFLHLIYLNNIPTAPQIAAWRSAVTAKYGGSVSV